MKLFKRTITLALAILMVLAVSISAFAAEAADVNNAPVAFASNTIDQSFIMTTSHTGSTRQYYSNSITYTAKITDVNGNPAGNIVAIKLYHANGQFVNEQQIWADGANHQFTIPITYGNSYYFQYVLAYGTSTSLKVHMIIN